MRAIFGAPRRMVFSAVLAAILRGSQGLAPQDDGQCMSSYEERAFARPVGSSGYDRKHTSAFSRRHSPEVCKFICPQNKRAQGDPQERAQGRPGARCTRGLMCKGIQKNAHEHTGSAEAVRPSLRNGFTAYIVLSPARPGLLVTVASAIRSIIADLTPAIGASGPHDFAVRFTRCSSKAHPRPSLPAPTSVTMANAPSLGTGCED